MATVNFSVPDDVKRAFDETFAGRNKSAVLAALMQRAVEETRLQRRRRALFDQLESLTAGRPAAAVDDAAIRRARRRGRP